MFQRNKKEIFNGAIRTSLIIVLLFFIVSLIYTFSNLNFKKVIMVSGQKLDVEVVRTTEEHRRGLSNRDNLSSGMGMLFVYENYNIPSFWMNDMKFPIDIIWVKDDMVVDYSKNLQPVPGNVDLPIYQPKTFVNYVLEVNAGFVDKFGIKIGDKFEFLY